MNDASKCVFCAQSNLKSEAETELIFAIKDINPVTEGHHLIIPKRHRKDFFNLTKEERDQSFELIHQLKDRLTSEDEKITGFNIGMNCGADAGQTVFHCHIHLIPRRSGDSGVRGVIPDKQGY